MESVLRELTSIVGPSGFEHEVVHYITERVRPWADECTVDGIGNIVVKKQGANAGPCLLVSTHMDEVGFIVKKIEENGLIRFEKLGGHDNRILLAQRVNIRTRQGGVPGVIGTISCHMMKFDDANRVRKHSEMYIDVGAADKAEVRELGIELGDPVSWATDVQKLGKYRLVGKGFDDRAGCAVLLKALEETDFSKVHGTIYAVFSVQEEVGLRGAKVAGQHIDADVALAIDTTAVSDTPEEMMDDTLELGKGPGIKVMDFSLIASASVRNRLIKVAENHSIPYQLEIFPGIGTDAGALNLSKNGVPSGVISIPSRYAHSPVEVIDLRDLDNCVELLKGFITELRDSKDFSFLRTE